MTERTETMIPSAAPPPLRVGPFKVSTPHAEIVAFCQETGWPEALSQDRLCVPHTFPMRWLSVGELRAAIETTLKASSAVALHESQSFIYEKRLDVDCDYVLNADIEATQNPNRLILSVSIAEASGEIALRIETVLRIVAAVEAAR